MAAFLILATSACQKILGEYRVEDDGASSAGTGAAGPSGCLGDGDCSAGQGCSDGVCRQRCIQDADCGPWRACFSDFCSDPPGTPCSSSSECDGSCKEVDNHAAPVEPYCAVFCDSGECPAGFECVDGLYCYQVVGSVVCPEPDTSPCGSCVTSDCSYEIDGCCSEGGCDTVLSDIATCDAERTYFACNELYNDGGVSGRSAWIQLLDCITLMCESSCWNPCPGEGC